MGHFTLMFATPSAHISTQAFHLFSPGDVCILLISCAVYWIVIVNNRPFFLHNIAEVRSGQRHLKFER